MHNLNGQFIVPNEEEQFIKVLNFPGASILPMVIKAAIELDLFEIMAKAHHPSAQLSAREIASHLPTKNLEASLILDRMLRFLASNSILTCSLIRDEDGQATRLYGMGPICKYFVRNQHGVSFGPCIQFLQDKIVLESWYQLKDVIIEGGIPFDKGHGMNAFEYPGKDNRFNEVFKKAMSSHSALVMEKILETYKGFEGIQEIVDVGGGLGGFEGIQEIVDVGGGLGVTLRSIVSKYPHIRGITFDLPHVIKDAPPCSGVEHVGGDMFESVPKGEAIFMKCLSTIRNVLHDWCDDHCLKILKNCWNALPNSGKVIVVELIIPEYAETDLRSQNAIIVDMIMLNINPGGKERTEKEFETLARGAGFTALKLICRK
ncbi:unnamed protein product [Ilex paraguariensis]|uniref:Caffeic acid O-methyltransferase n=1 Tax=Ilex paraguariensis TaxID=185542 RepID=A0ABC8SYU4_9AQUA